MDIFGNHISSNQRSIVSSWKLFIVQCRIFQELSCTDIIQIFLQYTIWVTKNPIQVFCSCKCKMTKGDRSVTFHISWTHSKRIKYIWNYSETVWMLELTTVICITSSFLRYILSCTYQGMQMYKDTECPHSRYSKSLEDIFLWVVMKYLYVATHSWSDCR